MKAYYKNINENLIQSIIFAKFDSTDQYKDDSAVFGELCNLFAYCVDLPEY